MISKGPGLGLVRHNALPAKKVDAYDSFVYAYVRMHVWICALYAYVHVCMYVYARVRAGNVYVCVVGVMPCLLRLARDL